MLVAHTKTEELRDNTKVLFLSLLLIAADMSPVVLTSVHTLP